jgi:hypothetical protein
MPSKPGHRLGHSVIEAVRMVGAKQIGTYLSIFILFII